jgi:hypothetical protein
MDKQFFADLQSKLKELVDENNLGDQAVEINCIVLKPEEAIGYPPRNDFPIQKGKEKMMQADFCGYKGQSFTDMASGYSGKANDIITMPLITNYDRAVFISGLNAVMRYLELSDRNIHCKNEGPEKCSFDLVAMMKKEHGKPQIALFGLQPAMAEALSPHFPLRIFDLDEDNIGKEKFGVVVESGDCDMGEVETWADVFLVTGSTLCNGSIVYFLDIQKPVIYFGTTIAGTASLLNLNRFCPQATSN